MGYVAKVHTFIGHDRGLCGVNPNRGRHEVVPLSDFFSKPETCQCRRCLELVERRGYSLQGLRFLFLPFGAPQ